MCNFSSVVVSIIVGFSVARCCGFMVGSVGSISPLQNVHGWGCRTSNYNAVHHACSMTVTVVFCRGCGHGALSQYSFFVQFTCVCVIFRVVS